MQFLEEPHILSGISRNVDDANLLSGQYSPRAAVFGEAERQRREREEAEKRKRVELARAQLEKQLGEQREAERAERERESKRRKEEKHQTYLSCMADAACRTKTENRLTEINSSLSSANDDDLQFVIDQAIGRNPSVTCQEVEACGLLRRRRYDALMAQVRVITPDFDNRASVVASMLDMRSKIGRYSRSASRKQRMYSESLGSVCGDGIQELNSHPYYNAGLGQAYWGNCRKAFRSMLQVSPS